MALYLDGQKIISGGGGSGGHTIVDSEGVSLEQRTNLQFNGTYSEDNATDDTTEINVVREMTKAEFDELTEDEKTGLINVTDVTANADDKFQPVIYSAEEREVGVWKDGKPLYQKTFIKTITCGSEQTLLDTTDLQDVDVIVDIFGNYGVIKLEHYDSSNYRSYVTLTGATVIGYVKWGTTSSLTATVTIQYTKTTDTAGSGQWTPQGVPAVHYSTDEQVVGTWVNGSTLYQKTIDKSVTLHWGTGSEIEDLTALDIDTFISCEAARFVIDGNQVITDNMWLSLRYDMTTKKLFATQRYSERDITGDYSVTIRYTKSST